MLKSMIIRKSAITLVACCLIGSLAGCAHEKEMVVSEADMPPPAALFERLTSDAAPGKTLVGILQVVASLPGERYDGFSFDHGFPLMGDEVEKLRS